jgi:glycosyltransferase involved in cell wall biosynthesis
MRPPPQKILITASTFPRWPNDTEPPFVYELAKRLGSEFEVHVLAPWTRGAKKFENIDGLRVWRFQYLPTIFGSLAYEGGILPKLKRNKLYYLQVPFFLLFQMVALHKIIKKEQIGVVNAHWIIPQGLVAVVYKNFIDRNVRVLLTVHGGDAYGMQSGLGNCLKRYVINYVDKIAVVSKALKDEVLKYVRKDKSVVVCPMGVDVDKFHPDRYDASLKASIRIEGPFLLFVGRLAEKKGVKYLISAIPEVLKAYPGAKLVIIGDGPLRKSLEQLVVDTGLAGHVVFLGGMAQEILPKYFATADIFIGPSVTARGGDREGYGLVFAEAMSSGTCVLATNIPAIADIVRDQETGFIVPEKSPESIATAILYILRDHKMAEKVKKNGRASILLKASWSVVTSRYTQLLQSR